jgi:hypothetical protein
MLVCTSPLLYTEHSSGIKALDITDTVWNSTYAVEVL